MDPELALARIVHCLDRAHVGGFKAKAWSGALARVRQTDPDELARLAAAGDLKRLPGIGDASARAISEALAGDVPSYLVKLEDETRVPITPEGAAIRAALRGDCHSHSTWSDGGASIEAMATTARDLGHDYLVLTDHSPRLTIAHGLNRERLLIQLDEIAALNETLAPFRILTGMEVDILEDGTLDLDDDLLERLDVVVASIHSKLRSDRQTMTQRMVLAVASPHVDILGHCTGRLIDKRPPSVFDADFVFAACAQFGTAVEINCRPERLDPPLELLDTAIEYGCHFSIDTDAHATGQLEWQPHGCDRAADRGVPVGRIINTWPIDDLLAWVATN
jgi:putative hydrolase